MSERALQGEAGATLKSDVWATVSALHAGHPQCVPRSEWMRGPTGVEREWLIMSSAEHAAGTTVGSSGGRGGGAVALPADAACTTTRTEIRRGAPRIAPRWAAAVLLGLGLAMIPWTVYLHTSLPATAQAVHWAWTWTGLDALEGLMLVATGMLLSRRDRRASLTATAASALLVVDAWFDTMTAEPGADRMLAVAMALGAEIPLAVMCAVLAWRGSAGKGVPCERNER